jgi:iodotyrosine deiodinase
MTRTTGTAASVIGLKRRPASEMVATARAFADRMATRRSVRHCAPDPVPLEVVEDAIRAAASAPSGANLQPWRLVVVTAPPRNRERRVGAEAEEREFYRRRASTEWLRAIEPLGTDWRKPYLEIAPVVIVVFEVHQGPHSPRPYYVKESVGIAVGMLISALHLAGLATLTHTPSPMRFLNRVCDRPPEERPYLVLPVGYPAADARVPDVTRKPLEEVMIRHRTGPTRPGGA